MPHPYPRPSSPAVTRRMRANPSSDTQFEVRLRSALHRDGLRFRKNWLISAGDVHVRPDIVFPSLKIAVFLDGCFWHGCQLHRTVPVANADYWRPKLETTRLRDRRVDAALAEHGWLTLRFWEHDAMADIEGHVRSQVERSRAEQRAT